MILAGLVIGEHGFNILVRDSSFELFGKVGLYYIMFLAGLEMNMGDFKQNRGKALVLGLLALLCHRHRLGNEYSFVEVRGTDLCPTGKYVCIAYTGGLSHRDSLRCVAASQCEYCSGGTAVTDTLTLLVLAVVGGMFKGESDGFFWVWLVIKVIFLGILIVYLFPRIGRWFFRRYDDNVMQFIFVLAIGFPSERI